MLIETILIHFYIKFIKILKKRPVIRLSFLDLWVSKKVKKHFFTMLITNNHVLWTSFAFRALSKLCILYTVNVCWVVIIKVQDVFNLHQIFIKLVIFIKISEINMIWWKYLCSVSYRIEALIKNKTKQKMNWMWLV